MFGSCLDTWQGARATLHTVKGEGMDGSCNQWGCAQGLGGVANDGRLGLANQNGIDSGRPFNMSAEWDAAGHMTIRARQSAAKTSWGWQPPPRDITVWDSQTAGNREYASAVPESAARDVAAAMERGMTLVASLWGGMSDTVMDWLDGGCSADWGYPKCELSESSVTFSHMRISPLSAN